MIQKSTFQLLEILRPILLTIYKPENVMKSKERENLMSALTS